MTASAFSVIQVTNQYPATQLVAGSGTPVMVVNNDPVTTVYFGDSDSIEAGELAKTTPFPPLATVVFDGTKDIYAICSLGQTANVSIYPTGLQYSQKISDQTLYTIPGTQNIPLGFGNFSTPVLPVSTYSSYDISIGAYTNGQTTSGAALALDVIIQWFADPQGTQVLFQESWWTWLGNSAANSSIATGSGPMHAPFMQVTCANPGVTNVVLDSLFIYASQRDIAYSDWRQQPPQGINSGLGFILPSPAMFDGDNSLLQIPGGLSIPANQTLWQPLPLYAGPVWCRFQTTVALAHNFVVASANNLTNGGPVAGTGTTGCLWNPADPGSGNQVAGHEYSTTLIAPRAPLYIVVATTGTSPVVGFSATAQQGVLN